MVSHRAKDIAIFYGIGMFVAMFTIVHHLTLYCHINSVPLRSIFILSSHVVCQPVFSTELPCVLHVLLTTLLHQPRTRSRADATPCGHSCLKQAVHTYTCSERLTNKTSNSAMWIHETSPMLTSAGSTHLQAPGRTWRPPENYVVR